MSHPFLKFFVAFLTGVKIANIDGGEEERDKERICENLPEELVIESILTKLPVRSLAVCCCISKLWYNSILNDSRFAIIHNFQNKDKVSLVFHVLNVLRGGMEYIYFFSLLGREKVGIRILFDLDIQDIYELVGFSNGLTCVKPVGVPSDTRGSITVVNSNRGETLVLPYLYPTEGHIYLGHGFGFDSVSQVYKAVMVLALEANNEFLCMVITLGTMSWRKIRTCPFDISPPLSSSLFPSPMVTRVSRTSCRQATLCRGDLLWRIKNNDIEMLLSFDLHNEKIHFIRFPTECNLITTIAEHQYLVVDNLLEYKGYPCIARSERIIRPNTDHYGHRCNCQTYACCCCCKVHMYILKDKGKQVWSREETFEVQIMDKEGLLPTPLCWYFDTSAAIPPTRISAFSDQVLLYWFNGEHLILYNLQEKHLKVVVCSGSYPNVFQSKMNEDLERRIGDDDNIYCPSMDYQLHAQVENIISLKNFIPKGAKISESNRADDLMHLIRNNLAAGWLTTGRETPTYYAFS